MANKPYVAPAKPVAGTSPPTSGPKFGKTSAAGSGHKVQSHKVHKPQGY